MSFVVVVPAWRDAEAWRALDASPFNRRVLVVARDEHGFCDGAAHQRRDRYRDSPYDTALFFLQNDAGAAQWPASDGALDAVRRAMARHARRDAGGVQGEEVQRERRRGRPGAEESGGRGGAARSEARQGAREEEAREAAKVPRRAPRRRPAGELARKFRGRKRARAIVGRGRISNDLLRRKLRCFN